MSCATAPCVYRVHSQMDQFCQLLDSHPRLMMLVYSFKNRVHGIQQHILTNSPPVFAHPWRLSPEKVAAATSRFTVMEKLGNIWRCESPWSSPLHLVLKKGRTWRPCRNFRQLNTVTTITTNTCFLSCFTCLTCSCEESVKQI